jgi:hypothetical protein
LHAAPYASDTAYYAHGIAAVVTAVILFVLHDRDPHTGRELAGSEPT